MDRELLFRGKSTETGEWVYGTPVKGKDGYSIVFGKMLENAFPWLYAVEPETIGEYTGLHANNGEKVFEGDILHIHAIFYNIPYEWWAIVEFGSQDGKYDWGWHLKPITGHGINTDILLWVEIGDVKTVCRVVGNIHDGLRPGEEIAYERR